jgi:hypothetical protein
MATRQRDYRKEYTRRVAAATQKGLSRSAARGHPATLGAIMSSYFGGRAEVHIRRAIVPTVYCDFASMYPTVCTLMSLWRWARKVAR